MPVARHLASLPLLAVTAIASLLTIASPRPARGAATIVVNSPVDEDANNDGCSLREAIIAANTNASHNGCTATGAGVGDKIVFNLGTGTPIINIGSTPLPTINEAVTIDGGAGRVVQGRVELHGPGGLPVSLHHGLNVGENGFGTIIRNLVINNFPDDGIFIDADEVEVFGCFIGTDAAGMTAVPNQGFGVQVAGGNGVRIGGATSGGPCTGDCNVISGAVATKANVLLDLNVTGAMVRGNFIGTDVTGTAGIANNAPGVIDKGGFDRIGGMNGTTPGGACTGDCNLISGNNGSDDPGLVVDQAGILIDPLAMGSSIQGNFIGTDVTGNDAIGNGSGDSSFGILSDATGAMIGGTTPQARNVVSGNLGTGIEVSGLSTSVRGNYIGTNSAGTAAMSNGDTNIYVSQANGVTIGGTTPGAGNLISGAYIRGVYISQSTNTQIVGNLIGTAADGTTPLPNLGAGVVVDQSSSNTIGGLVAAATNTIAFNGVFGVYVGGANMPVHGNAIRGNSIYANGEAGIRLIDDANDKLATPKIEGSGPLHGSSCAPCTVEIFSDADNEGRVFEGSVFTTDGSWTFNGPLSGPHVTATNTDMSNNTSEFSEPFSLLTPTPTPSATVAIPTSTATRTPTRTSTSSETPTSSSTPTPTWSAPSTVTRTATATGSATATPTLSPSATGTGSSSPTNTGTASSSATPTVTSTGLASPTPTVVRTATPTPTMSGTATSLPSSTPLSSATPTGTPARSASATPSATTVSCTGDCNGSGAVSINELIIGVNIALGTLPPSACPAFENVEGTVDIAQLIRGVTNSLTDCKSVP